MTQNRAPLTMDELHAIGQRNKENADVKALLWEIKRYHNLMSRFYQLARSVPPDHGSLGMIASLALKEMAGDPVVLEVNRQNAELFGPKSQPGDDD